MEFTLNGVTHSLDREAVRSALRGGAPDDIREHWVDVDGVRWPPKQALATAKGLDRREFTSHFALRQLQRLGFTTSSWSGDGRTGSAPVSRSADPTPPAAAGRTEAAIAPGAGRVVLVGCSQTKAPVASPARDLFTGPLFRKARARAERSGVPWYVLSAKFGLLDPDEVVSPYDVYLGDRPAQYRTAWGRWVVAQLAERRPLDGVVVEVHAGRSYCEPLREALAENGALLEEPLTGLRQGERLAWYGSAAVEVAPGGVLPTTAPDVMSLLDENTAVSPQAFLAAGRAPFDQPGLYSWWVDRTGALALSAGLGHRVAPGLIYAGRAGGRRPTGTVSTNTLWGRIATMHLGGNREFSTFRLSLGAVLQQAGEPVGDEAALTEWMHRHLRVATLPVPADGVLPAEQRFLELADPPLNLRDVPKTALRQTLTRLRNPRAGGG